MKDIIKPTIIKRNMQLVAFIITTIVSLGIIIASIMGNLPMGSLIALIPATLMNIQNIKMWDVYNDIIVLQKCMFDKEFLDNFKKENGI